MQRIIIILLISAEGFIPELKACGDTLIAKNNKDVFILATLIRDHLLKRDNRDLKLEELVQNDTLKRIAGNFESIEIKTYGGYFSVRFKFAASRNTTNIVLTDKETILMNSMRWRTKEKLEKFDGEIQFTYPEKFYHIKKIVMRSKPDKN